MLWWFVLSTKGSPNCLASTTLPGRGNRFLPLVLLPGGQEVNRIGWSGVFYATHRTTVPLPGKRENSQRLKHWGEGNRQKTQRKLRGVRPNGTFGTLLLGTLLLSDVCYIHTIRVPKEPDTEYAPDKVISDSGSLILSVWRRQKRHITHCSDSIWKKREQNPEIVIGQLKKKMMRL